MVEEFNCCIKDEPKDLLDSKPLIALSEEHLVIKDEDIEDKELRKEEPHFSDEEKSNDLNTSEVKLACELEINIERLIELVEEREGIWDVSSEIYKDRNLKKEAWIEICQELNPEFNNLDKNEKNKQCKVLQVKWKNLREKYMKYLRTGKKFPSGSGSKIKKPYVYSNHLAFLNKLAETAETTSSIPPDNKIEKESETDRSSQQKKPSTQRSKRSKNSNFEDELLKKLDMPVEENRHVSFIKGILPTLNTLTEDEIFEWQHSVVESLYSIKKRKLSQNSAHFSGTQASSSNNNQCYNLQPLQNLNFFTSQTHHSQPIDYSSFQNFAESTPVPVQSPIDSVLSDASSLLDI